MPFRIVSLLIHFIHFFNLTEWDALQDHLLILLVNGSCHVGRDETGGDGIRGDGARRILTRHGLGQTNHAGLCGRVVGLQPGVGRAGGQECTGGKPHPQPLQGRPSVQHEVGPSGLGKHAGWRGGWCTAALQLGGARAGEQGCSCQMRWPRGISAGISRLGCAGSVGLFVTLHQCLQGINACKASP